MTAKFFHGSEEKNKKEKGGEVEVDIKFRVNKMALERTAYITTILTLLGVIAFLIYFPGGSIIPKTTGAVVEEIPELGLTEDNSTETTEEAVEETPEAVEETVTATTTTTTTTIAAKTKVEAELTLEKSGIETEGTHPSIKVTSIKYKINNKGAKFTAKVLLRWYDTGDDNTLKEKIRATDEFIIQQDAIATRTVDEFSSKYLNSENDDEMFTLELRNSKDNELLDTEKTNYTP
jgi:hypothetical protein|tara:strand:+ start:183 stop:884 length:702 start_codon:yes stop_codon:yes gene_type:complete